MSGAVRARAGFVEGDSWAHEQNVARAPSGVAACEPQGSLPATGRHPGPHRRSSVRAAERRQPRRLRLNGSDSTLPKAASSRQRVSVTGFSGPPCSHARARAVGSALPSGASVPVAGLQLRQRHRSRGQPRGRAGKRFTGGCARVSRRLHKSANSARCKSFVAVVAVARRRHLAKAR
jgi:hypothetical protein